MSNSLLTATTKTHSRIKSILLTCALTIFVILASSAGYAAPKEYLDFVSDAVTSLQEGLSRESLDSLRKAIECNSNDPLAHVALGLTLLDGGRPDDALFEFNAALETDENCAEAMYGQGLIYLDKGQFGAAVAAFCQAQSANPELGMQGTIEYVKSLSSGTYTMGTGDTDDESLAAVNALAMMGDGRHSEARAILARLQERAVRPGFGERIGSAMTFVKGSPLVITGWPLTETYRSPSVIKEKLQSISGDVVLRADLKKARSVELVTFYVDNRLVAITNQSPYQYTWSTKRFANGPHTVKIVGTDAYSTVLSEKSMNVFVQNASNSLTARVTNEYADKLWAKLWDTLRLKPSVAAVNYNLALCAMDASDHQTARNSFERVLAADPNYLNAANRLAEMNKANGSSLRICKVDTNEKLIALSFDDGPKDHTPELLDVLKQKDVKATFFVVGKQAEAFPQYVKRMADEGHEVENHTYTHRSLEYLNEDEVVQEIFRTSAIVQAITGVTPKFVRPPGGHEGKVFPEVMQRFDLSTVMWTVNCSKFEGTTTDKMVDYVVASSVPGAVVLMHNTEMVTLNSLSEIIDILRSRGYKFVTLSEMVRSSQH